MLDDLFWFFLLLKIYDVCLINFSPAEGELKIYDVGLVIFWKYVFLKNMMSFSSAEGELKIYDVGLMVRRLHRKKRNISQTPDKEIRKIWLENLTKIYFADLGLYQPIQLSYTADLFCSFWSLYSCFITNLKWEI